VALVCRLQVPAGFGAWTAADKTAALPMTDAGVLIARLRSDVALPCSRSRDAWWFFMDLGFARAGEFGFPAIEAPSSHHNHAIGVHCAME